MRFNKGAPARKSCTGGWLVSLAWGCEKKKGSLHNKASEYQFECTRIYYSVYRCLPMYCSLKTRQKLGKRRQESIQQCLGDSGLPYLEINFTCEWHSCSQPCISPTSFKWSLAQAPVKNLLPQRYLSLMPRDTQSVQIVIAA